MGSFLIPEALLAMSVGAFLAWAAQKWKHRTPAA
jgi:hypothetical protein